MASRPQILLFSLNYEPEPTGSAPYIARLARHLAGGAAVTVVAAHPHYPHWKRRRVSSDRESNPRVLRYPLYVPRRPATARRALYELSWLASASRALVSGGRPDVALAVIPALSGGVLGVLAARRHRVPVGIVLHDLIGPGLSQSGMASGQLPKLVSALEAGLLRRASQVAVLCEDFQSYLRSVGVPDARILRFRNWARLGRATEGVGETRRRLGWSPADFVCLHAGNMGLKQGLENVLEAAVLARPAGVRVVLAGDGNDRPHLEARARELDLDNLSFLSVQPPGAYESMLAAADVLLLNQRPAVREMSMPSKLTAYFAAGRPLVAAIDAESAAGREIRRARAGRLVVPGDPRALAEALVVLKESPDECRRLGSGGRTHADTALRPDADLQDYDQFVSRLLADR